LKSPLPGIVARAKTANVANETARRLRTGPHRPSLTALIPETELSICILGWLTMDGGACQSADLPGLGQVKMHPAADLTLVSGLEEIRAEAAINVLPPIPKILPLIAISVRLEPINFLRTIPRHELAQNGQIG
jgi:hypothetical protein